MFHTKAPRCLDLTVRLALVPTLAAAPSSEVRNDGAVTSCRLEITAALEGACKAKAETTEAKSKTRRDAVFMMFIILLMSVLATPIKIQSPNGQKDPKDSFKTRKTISLVQKTPSLSDEILPPTHHSPPTSKRVNEALVSQQLTQHHGTLSAQLLCL